MLDELHVSSLGSIEDATFRPSAGLTVLTGETGAGKTMLVGACKLLVGERASNALVRDGAKEAVVEARFLGVPALDGQEGLDGEIGDDGELVVRRSIGADGRSRASVNGKMAAVKALGECARPLLELCGQHDQRTLLEPSTHVGYLDDWIGEAAHEARGEYLQALKAAREARAAYDAALEAASASASDVEVARFTIAEIERANPQEGEVEAIEAELPALEHAEELSQCAAEALNALKGDGGCIDALAMAAESVGKAAALDPSLQGAANSLFALADEAQDISRDLRSYRDSIQFDSERLEESLSRLGELNGLCKRYGPRMCDVLDKLARARAIVSGVDDSAERLASAKGELDAAEGVLAQASSRLARVRKAHAGQFCSALADAAHDLQMQGARFELGVSELDRGSWTDLGSERIEMLFAADAGTSARPLAKIASGGELSRVMLALWGTVRSHGNAQTLVFDEIDAGVGGTAGVAVARRLAMLARTHQVVAVTHLAQVAARADVHFVVSKVERTDGRQASELRAVEGEEREREIARMLAGDQTQASIGHARELLALAEQEALAL